MTTAGRRRQQGAVVLLIVAFLLLGGLLLAYTSFNVAAVRVDRDRATNTALAKAKDALIAFAVTHLDGVPDPAALARPGQLPCPDVNDDGRADADTTTGACTSLIGRLPWFTLGIPDLRDDSGERLWYAVSNDFRTDYTAPPAVPLNSDTAYRAGNASLTLNGTTPVTNLAALVVSPGGTLIRSDGRVQTRGCGAACDPRDFLDVVGSEDNADSNRIFAAAPRSTSFNDTFMPVFSDDIMRLVERRAARELAQHVRDHYDMWAGATVNNTKGFYPWAAPLNDPSVAAPGVNNATYGQLPLSTSSITWQNASAPILGSCTGVNTAQIECSGLVLIPPIGGTLTSFTGSIRNVGTAFIDPPDGSLVTVDPASILLGPPTITWTLNPNAQRINFTWSALIGAFVRIYVRVPNASSWTTSSWLARNNWHQDTGYALSSGYALNGADSCGGVGPSSCLTLANTTAPIDNKQALVVIAGRALAGQAARPVTAPANAADFVEGLNVDGNITEFESNLRTATFNDTVIAVRP
jgi:hypothetical protein